MRVVVLSPYPEALLPALEAAGDEAFTVNEPISVPLLSDLRADWIVSYGYRHMIRQPVLDQWAGRVINLHISLLPFNRGSDPNFWSWFDGTPKGITIHQVDPGLDTGPILAQHEVAFSGSETLRTSYDRLRTDIEKLFEVSWPAICGGAAAAPQGPGGTYHRQADKDEVFGLLSRAFDTPVREVEELGVARRRAAIRHG
jgi:methionyl-tRNA formyltransferase